MKKLSFAKSLASVGLAAVCALGIVGCSEQTSDTPTYTGGVAATVNGVEIPEDKVTQAIQDIRAQMSLTEEDAWGQWLADNDYTPESVREEIVNSFVDQELVKQGGEAEGITADPTEIDQYVETMRGHYDSDSAWAEFIEAVGMTEDEYRDNIALSLVSQQLQEKVGEGAAEPTDEEVLESAKTYVSSYDGAKKSSHILFEASDEAQAQEVLDKINAGELDFATAAESYSKDTASAAEGGNVGWQPPVQPRDRVHHGPGRLEQGRCERARDQHVRHSHHPVHRCVRSAGRADEPRSAADGVPGLYPYHAAVFQPVQCLLHVARGAAQRC